ncbi:MAG: hypothetical protein IIX58_00765 [Alistipes sp.]|nr:hypothetical protein [Alistipes sp.]
MIKLLKNIFSIRTLTRRMRVAFMSLLLLLFFSGAMSLFELERVSKDTEDILLASKENVDLAGSMLTALNEQNDVMITLAVASGKFEDIKRHSARCEESISQLEQSTTLAQRRMKSTDTPEAADSLVVQTSRVNELARSYISGDVHRLMVIAGDSQSIDTTFVAPTTHEWYVDQYKPEYERTAHQITEYMTGVHNTLGPEVNNLSHTARRAVTPVFISLVVMVVIVIMFYFFVNHYFVRPVLRINRSLGDYLTYKKPFDDEIACRDEIVTLRDRIAQLIAKFTK